MSEVAARLFAKCGAEDRGHESACWIWTASVDNGGYGKFGVSGRVLGAHRVAYELLVGPVPEGLELDHLCRERACINPTHLEPVTRAENHRRGYWVQRTHCVNGHPFDEANTYIRADNGWRVCRSCDRERQRQYALRKREAVDAHERIGREDEPA
jgi:hypothetical protein